MFLRELCCSSLRFYHTNLTSASRTTPRLLPTLLASSSPVLQAPNTEPIRITGVYWNRRNRTWVYNYYVNGALPRWRHFGSFSAGRFGFHLAKKLAEVCRLTAERYGIAVISDSNKVTRLKEPAAYHSDVEGVRWYGIYQEWRAEWIVVDGTGLRHRNLKRFPVEEGQGIDEVRIEAENFRRQISAKSSNIAGRAGRRTPGSADFQSGVPYVVWHGPGAGEIKNGVWGATLLFRGPEGNVVKRLRKGFSVNKYGFEGAKQLAIEAVRNHNQSYPFPPVKA